MVLSVHFRKSAELERLRYFSRQLITAEDMTDEQSFFRQKLRRHNRFLHGWGVVCGCKVEAAPVGDHAWQVQVSSGYAVSPQGDEIYIPEPICFDPTKSWPLQRDACGRPLPCPPSNVGSNPGKDQLVYLAVRYSECDVRPVRVHPAGCACDEAACEYARTRESFELTVLWELPKSHEEAAKADAKWCGQLKKWDRNSPAPVPDCPECPEDPWVVLASLKLPAKQDAQIDAGRISYEPRRVLYSGDALYGAFTCTP